MIFKCKMCGGDIVPIENTNTGKCLYCKSVMTLPNLNDEKIVNLYNRANNLRLANEFDKSFGVYETILEIDNEQIEAHWGLLLCKFGVEYVDDPKTKKKIPTCHRTITSSIFDDVDYKYIIKNSYGEALELYQTEAKNINNIQKKILNISSKEDPYDIFICYKETDENGNRTIDSVLANDIYEKLTSLNYKVFFSRITLEDKLGTEYEPYIFSALNSAKLMLVVGTSQENLEAVWVKNEWSRYLEIIKKDNSKTLIPVYSKMNAYELPDSFSMIQSLNMDKVGAMQDLIHGIEKIMGENKKNNDIDEEMFLKFKQILEKEKQKEEKFYETKAYKISTNPGFTIITFVLSLVMAIWMIGLYGSNSKVFIDLYDFYSLDDFSISYIIQLIVALSTFIAFFVGFTSKKGHMISKLFYTLNIILENVLIFSLFTYGVKPTYIFLGFVIINLLLLVIRPKWSLKTSILMLNEEEKNEQLEQNEKIEELYSKPYNLKLYIILIVISIIMVIACYGTTQIKLLPQSNEIDNSKVQVKAINEYIRIRKEANSNSSVVGYVHQNEIYTVLNDIDSEYLQIKTRYGLEGYISKNYVEILKLSKE